MKRNILHSRTLDIETTLLIDEDEIMSQIEKNCEKKNFKLLSNTEDYIDDRVFSLEITDNFTLPIEKTIIKKPLPVTIHKLEKPNKNKLI